MINQAEIHEMVSGKKIEDRRRAAGALGSDFSLLPDKLQGWQDLLKLTQDQDSEVRRGAAYALGSSFAHLPDRDQGQQDLHRLTKDQDSEVRAGATDALSSAFSLLSDRAQGWQDLHRLTQDQDSEVRRGAADALGSSFAFLPDKLQGWQDLHRLAQDQDRDVRWSIAVSLGSYFAHLPDKDQGQQDLHRLTKDQHSGVRQDAAYALGSSFVFLPDKNQGWQDLHRLTHDQDRYVRWGAAYALGSSFAHLPDKDQGWQDLLRLTRDQDRDVRRCAAYALGAVFFLLPDKNQGWQDLHWLTQDQESYVRQGAARALGSSFAHQSDKMQGWQDLHRLTQDQESNVRRCAARALGSSFAHLLDKDQGWQDLHRFTQDHHSGVRWGAADALGSSFAHLPDKMQGWQDLHRLTQDQDGLVRMYAYHSLGSVSVHKASEADEKNTIRSELEAAVEFFEKSSRELSLLNPASFCLPFYRSYLALTFQEASKAEVQKYLAEAKEAVDGSENKKELLGAVKNLAKALEETQKLKEKSKENIQSDLKAYRWYCDRAAEHMDAAEDSAPGAVGLLRKCNPIIEERIEATIAGIQKVAREICQVTRGSGTKYEAPGAEINREARSLSSKDPIKAFKSSIRIAAILREFCRLLPSDKRGHGCEIVDEIEVEQELFTRFPKIELALTYLQPNICLEAYESATMDKLDQMDKKLSTIIFDISQIKIGSGNIFANLCAVRTKLEEIAEMEKNSISDRKGVSTNPAQSNEDQIKLDKLVKTKFQELEEVLKTKATKEDILAILKEMENLKQSLKPSTGFEWLGRIADVIAVFDASIKVLAFLI
ncbi:MAG: HEAT repeat domain-containing protein [Methanothrix sp.]|nr:HEAT repeat domain-containing protein [Methanothrix sp.]